MKIFPRIFLALAFLASPLCLHSETKPRAAFPLAEASYMQRGILRTDGFSVPVSVFVKRAEDGSRMLKLTGDAGGLAFLRIDSEGSPAELSASAFFREEWVSEFVLRDFKNALGFADANYTVRLDSLGRPAEIFSQDYSMTFSDYAFSKSLRFHAPRIMEIKAKNYTLKLRLIER